MLGFPIAAAIAVCCVEQKVNQLPQRARVARVSPYNVHYGIQVHARAASQLQVVVGYQPQFAGGHLTVVENTSRRRVVDGGRRGCGCVGGGAC